MLGKLSWCQRQSRRREKEGPRTSSPVPQFSGPRLQGVSRKKASCKEPSEVILARKPLCFSNGRGARGDSEAKRTALSQNRRRRQKWGTMPRRDPGPKDVQDCFVHFGAMLNRATDHDRLGWEPARTDVYKQTAELPGPGLGPVASTKLVLSSPPHPIFPEGASGTHHPGTESAVGRSRAGAAGGSCLPWGIESKQRRARRHTCTHRLVLRACPRGPSALLPVAQGLHVQPPVLFSTRPLGLKNQSCVSLAGPGKS